MRYRLEELATIASGLGLHSIRVDEDRLDVVIHDSCRLAFCNLSAEADTLVGFDGTPWHSHGVVQFRTGNSTYAEYDELELLTGLGTGELLVVTRCVHEELQDRWITHCDEPLDVRDMEPGEELRVLRLSDSKLPKRSTRGAGSDSSAS